MIHFAAASAAVAVAVAVLSAGAASASEYRIPIGDLDFATPQGASTFDRRVRSMANAACRSGSPFDQARCRVLFRGEALSQLPDPRREDYARTRSGRVIVRTPVDRS